MELSTSRLVLREFGAGDFPAVREFQGSAEMYYFERGALSEEDSRTFLHSAEIHAQETPRTLYRMGSRCGPPGR